MYSCQIEIEVVIRKNVIHALYNVSQQPPEKGGFLFGTYSDSKCTVEHFMEDLNASCVKTFTPSVDASKLVQDECEKCGLSFLGVVHSHPGNLDYPSSGDMEAMNSVLELNTHMPYVLTPIISLHSTLNLKEHECPLVPPQNTPSKQTKISFYLKLQNSTELVHPHKISLTSKGPSNFTFSRQIFAFVTFHCQEFRENRTLAWNSWDLTRIIQNQEDCLCARFKGESGECILLFSPGNELKPIIYYEGSQKEQVQNVVHEVFDFKRTYISLQQQQLDARQLLKNSENVNLEQQPDAEVPEKQLHKDSKPIEDLTHSEKTNSAKASTCSKQKTKNMTFWCIGSREKQQKNTKISSTLFCL